MLAAEVDGLPLLPACVHSCRAATARALWASAPLPTSAAGMMCCACHRCRPPQIYNRNREGHVGKCAAANKACVTIAALRRSTAATARTTRASTPTLCPSSPSSSRRGSPGAHWVPGALAAVAASCCIWLASCPKQRKPGVTTALWSMCHCLPRQPTWERPCPVFECQLMPCSTRVPVDVIVILHPVFAVWCWMRRRWPLTANPTRCCHSR